ncbi:hypothetical protein AB0M46_11285 [Dactylosporangium sp. NPDC051485]|uniref:TolB family protein n=1 Tax=Dactylosporangium sp. NPDC051485 TaxID=3154846 RepID=UPI00342D2F17
MVPAAHGRDTTGAQMHTTTFAKVLTVTGLAAGFVTMFGTTDAQGTTTPQVSVRHGAIYVDGTRVTGDRVNTQPALSPDATRIAYLHHSTVWVMHVDGTAKHQVSDRTGSHPAWDAGGVRITYTATSCTGTPGTFRTGTEGGEPDEAVTPAACVGRDLPPAGSSTG